MDGASLQQAVGYYQKAAELNPRSDSYWMDLAGAREMLGETSRARYAYEKTKLDHPVSREVAWRYGSLRLARINHCTCANPWQVYVIGRGPERYVVLNFSI